MRASADASPSIQLNKSPPLGPRQSDLRIVRKKIPQKLVLGFFRPKIRTVVKSWMCVFGPDGAHPRGAAGQ